MAFSFGLTIWVLALVCANLVLQPLMAQESRKPSSGEADHGIIIRSPPPPGGSPPPSPHGPPKSNVTPFRPSVAVIVGVLTTMFSITFLLLLYAKHCNGWATAGSSNAYVGGSARPNSGISRAVIESLPLFRFGSLVGQKEGLECAVCLARFEPAELLRLLPKCKHAFHVECVDTWLDAHSTCPLCRYRVDPEDVLLVDDRKPGELLKNPSQLEPDVDTGTGFRRISGRHSSAGEKSTGLLQAMNAAFSRRRSVGDTVSLGCFDQVRKDTILTTERERFEHRIVISNTNPQPEEEKDVEGSRRSGLNSSDLLFLSSEEMIVPESGRASCSVLNRKEANRGEVRLVVAEDGEWGGRSVLSTRCMSGITGLSRHRRDEESEEEREEEVGGRISGCWASRAAVGRSTITTSPTARPAHLSLTQLYIV